MGRERELAAIRESRRAGEARGVLIVGVAGVGKTRLARVALDDAALDGAEVAWVRATASAATIPLAAVVDLLAPGAAVGDPLRVFQASSERLAARAGDRPLVVGVDDAHLLDPGSAALLLHLADKGAFIIATLRAGERPPDAVTALWKDERGRRLELESLGETDTARLVEELLAGRAERVLIHWARDASAGNPLYLRELVRGAVDARALEREEDLWRLRRYWPPGPALAELVAHRMQDLGAARRLLAAVSLAEPLAADLAVAIGGAEPLAELEARELVVAERVAGKRVVRLGHPLYGDVARQALPDGELVELRVALATAVRARGLRAGDAMRVATWLRDAGAPIDRALLLDAAREAYGARDPALAADLADRAHAAAPGFDTTLARGQALAALGRQDEAERAFAAVRAAPPSPGIAMGYLFARINVLVWGLRRAGAARRLVEEAADWWPDQAWREQAAALRLMVLSATGAATEAAAVADELAARPDLHPAAAGLLHTSGAIAWLHVGRTAAAQAAAERALPSPPGDERLDDRQLAGLVAWALTRLESGREWDAVEGRVGRIERAAVRRGDRIAAGPAAGLLGNLALVRGRPRTSIRRMNEALGHLELHDPRGLSVIIAAQIAIGAGMLGDVARAADAEEAARERLASREPLWHETPPLARSAAWVAAAGGAPTHGVEVLLAAAAAIDTFPLLQAGLLRDALSLGAPAARVATALDEAAARTDAPLALATAAHARALAGEDPQALVRAAVALRDIGACVPAAEAASQAAAILAAEGRPAAARRAAVLGAGLLEGCEGAETPALRASALEPSGLTRREHEIAALAAAGRSNAEIAAQLVVSVRTVESHLYHAMAKLGTRRRDALADALAHHPSSDY